MTNRIEFEILKGSIVDLNKMGNTRQRTSANSAQHTRKEFRQLQQQKTDRVSSGQLLFSCHYFLFSSLEC